MVSAITHSVSGTDVTSCGVNDSRDIWYTFTAPTDGSYLFNMTPGATDEGTEGTIAIFDGCEGAELACAVSFSAPGFGHIPAMVSLTLTAGRKVYVRVAVENDASAKCDTEVIYP